MGMPTVQLPPGSPGAPGPAMPASLNKPPGVTPLSSGMPTNLTPPPPAPSASPTGGIKPLTPMARPAPVAAPPPPPATPSGIGAGARAPLISGAPTKKSQLVERVLAAQAVRLAREIGLDPDGPEIVAIARLSAEVIERIVWEVVPDLAEAIIRENLDRLAAARAR
jgi:hypothetical protein